MPPPDSRIRRVQEKLAQPDAVLLVAADQAQVVGMLLAEPGLADDLTSRMGDLGHISMVFVRPEAARQGVGTLLLRTLDEVAVERGWRRLSLWTRETNTSAQALYRRSGFTRTSQQARLPGGDEIVRWQSLL